MVASGEPLKTTNWPLFSGNKGLPSVEFFVCQIYRWVTTYDSLEVTVPTRNTLSLYSVGAANWYVFEDPFAKFAFKDLLPDGTERKLPAGASSPKLAEPKL